MCTETAGNAQDGKNECGEGCASRVSRVPELVIVPAEGGDVNDAMDLLELIKVDGHKVIRFLLGRKQGLKRLVRLMELGLSLFCTLLSILRVRDSKRTEKFVRCFLHEVAKTGQLDTRWLASSTTQFPQCQNSNTYLRESPGCAVWTKIPCLILLATQESKLLL